MRHCCLESFAPLIFTILRICLKSQKSLSISFIDLYVDDFLRIMEIFINNNAKERSYNICTGNTIDFKSLAKIINEIDGRKLPIKIKEDGLNPQYSGNNELFMNEFKRVEFTPPEKAITDLYYWYKNSSNIEFRASMFNLTE